MQVRSTLGFREGVSYTFVTDTTVVTLDGVTSTTSLTSDMAAEPGWLPYWAEAIFESWFATRCEHFPCSETYSFSDVVLRVANASRSRAMSWSTFYEVENTTSPGSPVCDGDTSADANGTIDVGLSCYAEH